MSADSNNSHPSLLLLFAYTLSDHWHLIIFTHILTCIHVHLYISKIINVENRKEHGGTETFRCLDAEEDTQRAPGDSVAL